MKQPTRRNRDRELVDYIGRHGVVTIDHVMAALGVGRAAAYRRTSACIEARLLERFELLRLEPSLLRATRRGLRYAGLGLPSIPRWQRTLNLPAHLRTRSFAPKEHISESPGPETSTPNQSKSMKKKGGTADIPATFRRG